MSDLSSYVPLWRGLSRDPPSLPFCPVPVCSVETSSLCWVAVVWSGCVSRSQNSVSAMLAKNFVWFYTAWCPRKGALAQPWYNVLGIDIMARAKQYIFFFSFFLVSRVSTFSFLFFFLFVLYYIIFSCLIWLSLYVLSTVLVSLLVWPVWPVCLDPVCNSRITHTPCLWRSHWAFIILGSFPRDPFFNFGGLLHCVNK
jgi:hypothetical protein